MHHLCRQLLLKEYKQSDAICMKYKHDRGLINTSLARGNFCCLLITLAGNSLNPDQVEPRSGPTESQSEPFDALADSVPQ